MWWSFTNRGINGFPFLWNTSVASLKAITVDKVQLCAQAICLEEMLNVEIKGGALFYGQTRRREDVIFDKALRAETEEAARKVHELIESGITPKAEYSKKCKQCSLLNLCLPKICGKTLSVDSYLQKAMRAE